MPRALVAVYVFYGGLLLAGVWGAALRLVPGFRSWAWRTRPRLPSGSYGQVSNYGQVRALENPTAAAGCLPAGRGRLRCWGAWRCCTSFGGCGGGGTPAAASAPRAGTAAISPTALHLSPKRSVTPPNCRRFLMGALSESWCGAWQARRWVI